MDLTNAVVYDIEVFPNLTSLSMEMLNSEVTSVWEISDYRDDRLQLMTWFDYLCRNQIPMIAFNSLSYDYPIIHYLFNNPNATPADLYAKSQSVMASNNLNPFANMIWDRDRFAPQIDLYKLHHMDNNAKRTSLKALEINMRSTNVLESPIPFGTVLTTDQVEPIIYYNKWDVKETKRFAHYSMTAIEFRIGLIEQFGIDVLNHNDTKIGENILIQKIGEDVCFERRPVLDNYGQPKLNNWGKPITKKHKRQTPRNRIALADIIFPYIQFQRPEFNRVLDFMRAQVLTPEDLNDTGSNVQTKGVFTNLTFTIDDCEYKYGTGGLHASVPKQRFVAGNGWIIRDIDVASLYPSVGIVNKLAPEHLGQAFVEAYASLPKERKEWQKRKGKKCVEANSMKLGANGAYGKTNDKHSCLLDPKYTMTVTIDGQLMLSMLAEWLLTVPTISIIAINTDGITYRIHDSYLEQAKSIEKQWEAYTCLTLEDAAYSRVFARDCNSYVAEFTDGTLKCKGAYWVPDSGPTYAKSISEQQPPAWHKDLGNCISVRAAVAAMVHGIDPETFIRACSDPYDFMLRVKVDRSSKLMLGGVQIQSTTRYYVARQGAPMVKISPPPAGNVVGQWKRAPRITKAEYDRVMAETGGAWDARVCTASKSTYQDTTTAIQAGWQIAECNDASRFRWDNVDYRFYVAEARKLII